jgi:hypothetical protein
MSISGTGTDQDGLFVQQTDPLTLGGAPGDFTFSADCRVMVGTSYCELASEDLCPRVQFRVVGLRSHT